MPHSPHTNARPNPPLSRRQVVQAAAAAPLLAALGACVPRAAPATPAALSTAAQFAAASWRSGGTASISAAARAMNPFAATARSCTLTCEATIGPCHTQSPQRVDVSDGWNGLPVHMVLRVVDTACQPIADAIVEIWHTNYTGGYSGHIVAMCNNNQADLSQQFFRGYQRSDAQGMVHFDTCFPGWYRGRANHVHLRVMKGDYQADDRAQAWAVTQLLFPDALNEAIFSKQPLYQAQGQPDTTLEQDNVVGNETNTSPYLFDVRNVDGVMVASKTLTLRTHLEAPSCQAQGKMPQRLPGGRRGPLPGFPVDASMPPRGMAPPPAQPPRS